MSLNRKTATGREVLASNGDVLVGGRDYEIYSENETMIGYWINKKPLYRRTFSLTAPNNTNTEVAIYTGLDSSIDLVTNFYGVIGSNSLAATNSWYAINHIGTINTTTEATVSHCYIRVDLTNREICCTVNNSKRTSAPLYITLEYTKSTDSAVTDTNTYSTEEKLTGETWINGKPIYRKVITMKTPASVTTGVWASTDLNISDWDIDKIITLKGFNEFDGGKQLPYATTTGYWTKVVFEKSTNTLTLATNNSGLANTNFTIICEYTKTTD